MKLISAKNRAVVIGFDFAILPIRWPTDLFPVREQSAQEISNQEACELCYETCRELRCPVIADS